MKAETKKQLNNLQFELVFNGLRKSVKLGLVDKKQLWIIMLGSSTITLSSLVYILADRNKKMLSSLQIMAEMMQYADQYGTFPDFNEWREKVAYLEIVVKDYFPETRTEEEKNENDD